MKRECLTCGARYDTLSPDGVPYFHACPLETIVMVTRAGREIEVTIHDLQPDDLLTVMREDKPTVTAVSALQPQDVRIRERTRVRAEARNENIDPRSPETARRAIAEGRGARELGR